MARKIVALVSCFLLLSLSSAWAGRPDKSWKKWFGHVSGAYNLPQGDAGDVLDNGWQVSGGATFWPEDWPVGLDLDLSYSWYDVSSDFINRLNQQLAQDPQNSNSSLTGGDSDIWALTADAMWSPGTGSVSFYLAAGVGAYYVSGSLNTTGVVYYPGYCYGWYWYYCYPGGVGPGTISLASGSTTEWGWNGGVGLNFDVGSTGSQLYIEAKYHSVQTDKTLEYAPITIGYRW